MSSAGVQSWSYSAIDNSTINGIVISEGCPAANINNAVRQAMSSVMQELVYQGADISASASMSLAGVDWRFSAVTSSASIIHVGTGRAGLVRNVIWNSPSTLVSSANILTDGGVNIVTETYDMTTFTSLGSGIWRAVHYSINNRANTLVVGTGASQGSGTINVQTNYYLNSLPLFLTADTTYYVRTDGSDSNTGTANTAGGAWLTLQHAWDIVSNIDLNGYALTIQVADGTYTGPLRARGILKGQRAGANVIIRGNSGTPTNVIVNATSPTSGATIAVEAGARITLKDMQLKATTAGSCLLVNQGSECDFSGLDFGACPSIHINVSQNSLAVATGNYTISGAAATHWSAVFPGSLIFTNARTVTISGTPAFSTAFAVAGQNGAISCTGMTFTGTATGTRYSATINGTINTGSGGATYLPGNVAGAASTGGQYV